MNTFTGHRITSRDTFKDLAERYDLVPLVLEMGTGEETPLSVYMKLDAGTGYSFLLESGDRGGTGGRYSFVGGDPESIFLVTTEGCKVLGAEGTHTGFYPSPGGVRKAITDYLSCKRPPRIDNLPPFAGGIVGYFGYGMVEEWEQLFHGSGRKLRPSDQNNAVLMGFVTMAAFDHETENLFLIHNVRIPEPSSGKSLDLLYDEGIGILETLKDRVTEEIPAIPPHGPCFLGPVKAHTSKGDFLEMTRKGLDHIIAGDICQVVLSQRFSTETDLPSLEIYRTLKEINPSPYLFFLGLPGLEIIGSSPEVLVKVEGQKVITRPLAGTRPRGASPEEDRLLAEELLADEKERAEHLMLVDLARNDLGRVCSTGTIKVTELMGLEFYSRVMHIVSQVEGERREDMSALEVLESAFPAGTVSGAPKIRAMEIIEDLESLPRGPYAGAVGYIGFDGDLDSCIVIRTMIREDNTISVQAGAGIVYDSVPEREYEETRSKASALLKALEQTLERRNIK
ncbi:MAG: chorismate-binding protein [Synergistales bacterium]|nr:chorismate-binding protein [Synergistales bacterium]